MEELFSYKEHKTLGQLNWLLVPEVLLKYWSTEAHVLFLIQFSRIRLVRSLSALPGIYLSVTDQWNDALPKR